MNKKSFFVFLLVVAVISAATRLLPHPPNFAPIAALALFTGVYATKLSKWFLLLPLAVMFISDMFLGFDTLEMTLVIYGSFFVVALVGMVVQRHKHWTTISLATLSGSLFFYLATNYAVWAFSSMYAPTFSGLLMSYYMALPFFKYAILGDIFYAALFFGTYEFAISLVRSSAFEKSKNFLLQ